MSESAYQKPSDNLWTCPNCHGWGTMPDAIISYGPDGLKEIKAASVCWLCKGKKKVRVLPLENESP